MGIGSTFSRSSKKTASHDERVTSHSSLDDSSVLDISSRTSQKLPPGTGIGTSGKPAGDQDLARSMSDRSATGFGTDAAAATGGSLSSTHQAAMTGLDKPMTVPGTKLGTASASQLASTTETTSKTERVTLGHAGVLDTHASGHSKQDEMPSGDTVEDKQQLHPVTHEFVRHLETEEVERVKDHERHVHHIQHHIQPVIASEELAEKHEKLVHPVTRIAEQHVNKVEDNTLFKGQVLKHKDTIRHGAKERTIVDKGTVINEHVHHHVHHVIQPVIEKETIDRSRIHTTIPIKEVTQEAPIIHQSQSHPAIPLEHFLRIGGNLEGGIAQGEISDKVLQTGACTREVDGTAEELAQKLHLGQIDAVGKTPQDQELLKTTVTQKTTTIIDPDLINGKNLPIGRN
ncbi:hypothetical protein BKA70DRAFT_1400272 [Coprinopsis sp. MPI-PUGE-AT-0042]|nr:hypothetical protein BKA70DRAFT_1400272 [Coprinopsis sp. MPI-PUGE-AT-0042]